MKSVRDSIILAMTFLSGSACILSAQQDSGAKNTPAVPGAYTVEQAARGERIYTGECARCHDVKDHTNNEFRFKWNGRTARTLFDYLRSTMPDDGPGELTEQQYLDVTTYILKLNGLPAGDTPLTNDTTALAKIRLELKALPTLRFR